MANFVSISAQLPASLSQWINHQGPLTDKLQAKVGTTELKLLSQQWKPTSWWEKQVLLTQDQQVFQREILMTHQDKAYWYAKTIIPEACYQLNPLFFNRLKSESIRNLIFDSQEVQRIQMKSYAINESCIEFYWLKHYLPESEGIFWLRFTELSFLQTKAFYLLEILLPELEHIV